MRHGAVRVRLDVMDVQAGMLLRAGGARRSRRADRARFTVTDGLHPETGRLRLAKYGWVRLAAPAGPVVGLNHGVKTAAIVATSQREPVAELPAVRALRDALRHVKHLQRDVSRTQKGSANRRKAVARLGRAHARAAAVRADALHTFTARLARAPTAWSSSRT